MPTRCAHIESSHTRTCPSSADVEKRPVLELSKLHAVIVLVCHADDAAVPAWGDVPPVPEATPPPDPGVLPRKWFRASLKAVGARSVRGAPTTGPVLSLPYTSHCVSLRRKSTGAQSKPHAIKHRSLVKMACKKGRPRHRSVVTGAEGPAVRSFTLAVASWPQKARNCPFGLNATALTQEPASSFTCISPKPDCPIKLSWTS
mmetsp:Transcript_33193/g.91811  ORF Transcript_33193/g.91811 Transcript_33193/m.91811 type:complete len:202 (-) Transcript_33193:706-1311(-)